ncbi:MAG TPA: helix-turn-helix transcriptional regulator [Candidatus Solibacter sp.]|jgi:transcriptional regulator with XRE-family HTH domain|nr:helix-turn-helix transcriptional regulator [Candidatus Solibacter sp.]
MSDETVDPAPTTFASRILELRRKAGLTQRKLADELGINFTYLSKLENGHGDAPADDTIRRLAEATGGDPEELLALAGKISLQLREKASKDEEFAMLLRRLPHLPPDVLHRVYRQAGVKRPPGRS